MSGFDDWLGQNVPDHIMEEAASWMALLDSESCTLADRVTFSHWLGEDPMHQGAFEELSEVWARLHTLADVPELIEHPDVIPFPAREEAHVFNDVRPPQKSEWSTLVASVLVISGACLHFAFGTPGARHVTEVGQIQTLQLEDGSQVQLNARSEITVQIDDKRREVRLKEGEAVFHVEKDARPFVVRTGLATVSAVGTHFSVDASSSMVEVSVIDGLVSVAATNNATALTEYDSDLLLRFTDEIALLGAGQRLEVTRENQRYALLSEDELQDDLSWRNGEVVFDQTPLLNVLAEMRTYQKTPIFVGDPILNSLRISGRFRTGDTDAFVFQLTEKYSLSAEDDTEGYIILRPR